MENEELTPLFLAALLRSGRWPEGAAVVAEPEVLAEAARKEGVAVALFDSVNWQKSETSGAIALRDALAREARRAAAYEILNRVELDRVLPHLIDSGHRFLLLKGTPLAYTLYPNPAQRTRCDTDVLVPLDEVPGVVGTLRSLGYREHTGTSGDLVSHQRSFGYNDTRGTAHVFDLHWKISNRPGLSDRVGFEELWTNSREVPSLGNGVRAPDDVFALLLACIHLAGHHPGEERLIWLYDIYLLARSLSASQATRFPALLREKGIVGPCAPVLSLTHHFFPSPVLIGWSAALGGTESRLGNSRIRPGRLELLSQDLQALPNWPARLCLLKEHAFPPAVYMRMRYEVRSNYLLPFYYAKRIIKGASSWLRRS